MVDIGVLTIGEVPFGSNMGTNGARGDEERAMARTDLIQALTPKSDLATKPRRALIAESCAFLED